MAAAREYMETNSDPREIARNGLAYIWAPEKRRDRPPNGWYTESNHERAIRGPRSTAPAPVSDQFAKWDAAVAKCTPLQRRMIYLAYVQFPSNGVDFVRKRLNMSHRKWHDAMQRALWTVASYV